MPPSNFSRFVTGADIMGAVYNPQGRAVGFEDLSTPRNRLALERGYMPEPEVAGVAITAPGAGDKQGVQDRWIEYRGQWFNLANAADQERLAQLQYAELGRKRNIFSEDLQRLYADRLAEIGLAEGQLGEQEGVYEQGVNQFLSDLLQGKEFGDVRRFNLFSAYGPQAYQSALGTSAEFAQQKYEEGRARKEEERERNRRQFGMERAGIARTKEDLEREFGRAQQEFDEQEQAARGQIASAAVADLQEIGRLPANFQRRFSYHGYTPEQVDLSELTPFINFQDVMRSPRANIFSPFLGSPQGAQSPLAQHLGYNDKDPNNPFVYQAGIRPYLMGYR